MKQGQVLLFSGGMDSLMAARQFPNATKLYIAVGSKYEAKELKFLDENFEGQFILDDRLRLSDMERDDAIIPARNLFLLAIASFYGNDIILSSVAGDRSTDKDSTFASLTEDLLTHIYQPPHFNLPDGVSVRFPGKYLSKSAHVFTYLESGGDVQLLLDSVSCYHPVHQQCGVCKACMRKWTALESNGLVTDHIWHTHPKHADWHSVIQLLNAGEPWRHPIEDFYTKEILTRNGVMK